LPPSNSLEGLCLLRAAWRDYDVAMKLAARYKFLAKVLYAFQLIFGWISVVASVYSVFLLTDESKLDEQTEKDLAQGFKEAVFFIAIAISFLIAIDGMFTPKARWRQLRQMSGQLQSMIWLYRTRTGPFDVNRDGNAESQQPERELMARLNLWREELVAAAALKVTDLKRDHHSSVYKHFQFSGTPEVDADDHHSPTQPGRYITLRILPAIAFYKKRVPVYTRRDVSLKVILLLFGIASSVLARYEYLTWVAVAAAGASMVKSWASEFQAEAKVERYSSSIVELEKLLSWWDSLSDVQKASRVQIDELVLLAETVISQEQLSWASAAASQSSEDKGDGEEGKEKEKKDK